MIRISGKTLFSAGVLALAVAAFGGRAAPAVAPPLGPLDTLQPGEWYEAPNTKLSASGVFPPSPPPPGNPNAVVAAWSGGAFDSKRQRLILHGGGHGDYAGNELYAFDITTMTWSRPWGPSANSDIPTTPAAESMDAYYDGNPSSVHSYDGMVYLPTQDKLWRGGGSKWSGSGGGTSAGWFFDFNSLAWERRAGSHVLGVSVVSEFDPVTGHIFAFSDHDALGEYDPVANTWTDRGFTGHREEMTATIDPVARLLVVVAGNLGSAVWSLDLQTGAQVDRTTTGGSVILGARGGPGLVYDPVLKKIVAWAGGTSVYSLDTSTWAWMEHPPAASNTVLPTVPSRVGTYGRFQYVPSKNLYVLVNSVNDNVFFYKLSPGGGGPPPTPTAPTITSQPSNKTVTAGQTAAFSVTASGTAPLSFQWQKNGTNISGATNSSYTTPASTLSDSGSSFRVTVSNSVGGATSNSAILTVNAAPPSGGSLPPPWEDQDIGSVGMTGSASASGGTFTVYGSGADIWDTADAFHFVYQTLLGDGEIVARITGLGNTSGWAKAGVMIRETLDPGSRFADMVITPGQGASFQWRDTTGGNCDFVQTPVTVPAWMKLTRTGNSFSGFMSSNGSTWTPVGSATTVSMANPVYIGLCVTAHNNGALTSATIESVSVRGGGGGGGAPPPASSSGGGGGHRCGALGLEFLAILGLLRLVHRKEGR